MSDLLQPIGGGSYSPPPPPPDLTQAPVPLAPTEYAAQPVRPTSSVPPRYEDPDKPPMYLYGIGGVVALAAMGWGVSLFLPSAPVDAPAAYVPFAAADKSFTCELPDKWRVEAMGEASAEAKNSLSNGVEARQSDAYIKVTNSSIAGLITGQLLYGDDPIPQGAFGSRARPIFNDHGKGFKKRFKGYKETKLSPAETQLPKMTGIVQVENTKDFVPDIRLAEFTATGNSYGLGGKRHGYRMAVGGSAQIVNVVCECSERDWVKLKPAFEKVMVSLAEPRPAGLDRGGVAVPGGATLPTDGEVPGFGSP
ncbi:MAG: hypothetical protein H7Y38_07495 [Armatimonadetes bacterium]|nr:hypothetical protein [Armatimonadota bacterium]